MLAEWVQSAPSLFMRWLIDSLPARSDLGEEGVEVSDLALDRIRYGVTAVVPAVVVNHGEMPCQLRGARARCYRGASTRRSFKSCGDTSPEP